MDGHKFTLVQKVLLFTVYGLILLMVVFSVMAIRNVGEEGYNRCIQEKCEKKGEAFCSKFREINNCCEGAGGNLGVIDNKYKCVFS